MPNMFRIGLVVDENEPLNVEEISKNPRFNDLEDAKINGIIEIKFMMLKKILKKCAQHWLKARSSQDLIFREIKLQAISNSQKI